MLRPASLTRSARGVLSGLAALLAGSALVACGGDDGSVADERSEQVRDAAVDAGLPEEVADVLALAARGAEATFRITYDGSAGTSIVVAQAPPERRIDIVVGGVIVESRVLRNGVGYACTVPSTTTTIGQLSCERRTGTASGEGAFTDDALAEFTASLVGSLDTVDLVVEQRTIAEAEATCLVSTPKAGTPLTGTEPGAETICLSDEGAQLLVDAGGERVEAVGYETSVPEGTFELPDDPAGDPTE